MCRSQTSGGILCFYPGICTGILQERKEDGPFPRYLKTVVPWPYFMEIRRGLVLSALVVLLGVCIALVLTYIGQREALSALQEAPIAASTGTPAPTPTPSCEEQGTAYREELAPLIAEWSQTVMVAQQAVSGNLDPHITHLQTLHRAFEALDVPDCWQPAHSHLLAMAEATIQAFSDRRAGKPAEVVNRSIQTANAELAAFSREEARIIGRSPQPAVPTTEPTTIWEPLDIPLPTTTPEPTPVPLTATPNR